MLDGEVLSEGIAPHPGVIAAGAEPAFASVAGRSRPLALAPAVGHLAAGLLATFGEECPSARAQASSFRPACGPARSGLGQGLLPPPRCIRPASSAGGWRESIKLSIINYHSAFP